MAPPEGCADSDKAFASLSRLPLPAPSLLQSTGRGPCRARSRTTRSQRGVRYLGTSPDRQAHAGKQGGDLIHIHVATGSRTVTGREVRREPLPGMMQHRKHCVVSIQALDDENESLQRFPGAPFLRFGRATRFRRDAWRDAITRNLGTFTYLHFFGSAP